MNETVLAIVLIGLTWVIVLRGVVFAVQVMIDLLKTSNDSTVCGLSVLVILGCELISHDMLLFLLLTAGGVCLLADALSVLLNKLYTALEKRTNAPYRHD